jgi:hypothetical protein
MQDLLKEREKDKEEANRREKELLKKIAELQHE